MKTPNENFNWSCKHTWKLSAKNTLWCLLGCSIGDFGTILFFQLTEIPFPILGIMTLAIINGLLTSIALETHGSSHQCSAISVFNISVFIMF